jgi:hypothetical protein
MFTPEKFRAKAAEYAELLKKTNIPDEIREFQRLQRSFDLLAQNEEWMAANCNKIVHSQDDISQGR